jgi:hypothetical protein
VQLGAFLKEAFNLLVVPVAAPIVIAWSTVIQLIFSILALFSFQNFSRFPITSNLAVYAWCIKYT